MTAEEALKHQIIPVNAAVICGNCLMISDANGETCPCCSCRGQLVSLAVIIYRAECESIIKDRADALAQLPKLS